MTRSECAAAVTGGGSGLGGATASRSTQPTNAPRSCRASPKIAIDGALRMAPR
jgi:hypothetical protein